MRCFVTGAHGFVGRWLVDRLARDGSEVVGVDHADFDVTDPEATSAAVARVAPDVVVHLAAQPSVARSFADPLATYRVNVLGTVSIVEAILRHVPAARLLVASSAEVYGNVEVADLPIREDRELRPTSPYAASKVAQEVAVFQAARAHGLHAIAVRSFNLVGPGQSSTFALPDFAEQLARFARGDAEPVLHVGNLEARRDFTDVRDAVSAYVALAKHGRAGEAYNLCSGWTATIREALDCLVEASGLEVEIRADPSRLRPVDIPCLAGNPEKLKAVTAWSPRRSLNESMRDLLEHAQTAVARTDVS